MFNEDEGRFCDHSIPNMRRAKCWAKERIGAILGLGWLVAYSIVGCAYHTALKFYKWVDLSCNVMQSSGDLRQICVSLGTPGDLHRLKIVVAPICSCSIIPRPALPKSTSSRRRSESEAYLDSSQRPSSSQRRPPRGAALDKLAISRTPPLKITKMCLNLPASPMTLRNRDTNGDPIALQDAAVVSFRLQLLTDFLDSGPWGSISRRACCTRGTVPCPRPY